MRLYHSTLACFSYHELYHHEVHIMIFIPVSESSHHPDPKGYPITRWWNKLSICFNHHAISELDKYARRTQVWCVAAAEHQIPVISTWLLHTVASRGLDRVRLSE